MQSLATTHPGCLSFPRGTGPGLYLHTHRALGWRTGCCSLYSIQQTPMHTYYVPGTQRGPKGGQVFPGLRERWTHSQGVSRATLESNSSDTQLCPLLVEWPPLYSSVRVGTTLSIGRMTLDQCIKHLGQCVAGRKRSLNISCGLTSTREVGAKLCSVCLKSSSPLVGSHALLSRWGNGGLEAM